MALPPPLPAPTYQAFTLPAGTPLVRVANDVLGATEPSVSTNPTRFTPVYRDTGSSTEVVPVLYAGEDLGCALGETVLRGQSDNVLIRATLLSHVLGPVRASFLETTEPAHLADLRDPALHKYGVKREDVVGCSPAHYDTTRLWSQSVWETTDYQGLVWNSYRSPSLLSFAFFIDTAAALTEPRCLWRRHLSATTPMPLASSPGIDLVVEECARRNVILVR